MVPLQAAQKISIHALREEGDAQLPDRVAALQKISIHALREEGDQSPPGSVCQAYRYFNPRPPRGGRRRRARQCRCIYKFQSTPSARRATALFCLEFVAIINFNPRPPRGGRLSGPW